MSDRVENELRAMLHGRASTVGGAPDPVAGVERGVRRVVARRRLAVAAGVPVLVGVVVGGAGLLSGPPSHHDAGAVAAPSAPTPALVTTTVPVQPLPASSASVVATPTPAPSAPVTGSTTILAPTPTSQVEIYRAYLEEDPLPRELGIASAGYGGRPYCGLRVLDQSTHYAYLWVACNEFYLKDGVLTPGSSGSDPVRLTISGTGAATRVLGAATPHSGSPERAELKALFSPLAFTRSLAYDAGSGRSPGVDKSAAELRARAMADVRAGQLRTGLNPIAP